MASDAASVRMRDAEPVRDADSDCAVSVLRKSKAGCNEPENHDGYSATPPALAEPKQAVDVRFLLFYQHSRPPSGWVLAASAATFTHDGAHECWWGPLRDRLGRVF